MKLNLEKVRLLIEDIVRTAGSQLLAYKIKYRGEAPEITDETGLRKKIATDFRTHVDVYSDRLIRGMIR